MSEEKAESKKTASICSIKGMRSAVFKRAHDKVKEYEHKGNTLMPENWKEMLSDSWVEVTDEIAKTCGQPGEHEKQEPSEEQSMEQEPALPEDVSPDETSEVIQKDELNA